MFTDGMKESNQDLIELKDESISPDALKIMMNSIYTGDLRVNEENVFEVLAAADHLQVSSVVQQCCDFLKREFIQLRLDLHNYCLLSTVADRLGLRDLQEAAEEKMTSMFKDICESEEFLTHIGADQLFSLLNRDDLSAPSETFVFKSVMQWIKYKKEERMAVAAKVIGAVRLGLVDIRVVIEELNTEEMQRVPEIHMHLHEVLLYSYMPSHNSKFAEEKSKPRSTSLVLIAVQPNAQMQYFDVEAKTWKPLASTIPAIEAAQCYCAVSVGSKLFVAGMYSISCCIFQYDTEKNEWERLLHPCGEINNLCVIDDHMYAISADSNQTPQRYSFAKRQWQSIALVGRRGKNYYPGKNGVIMHSKVFVLYENRSQLPSGYFSPAILNCFDPVKNEWEVKATTCQPHFGSSLFGVDNRLYVAGGYVSTLLDRFGEYTIRGGNSAPVEVYNDESNTWSVVEQKHIPSNNLGAVEIEGRVYFIINNFPIDSGIRIAPGELYPVPLGEWENIGNIYQNTVLGYLPVKRESLKTE